MGLVAGWCFVSRFGTRHDFYDFHFRFHNAPSLVYDRASLSLVPRACAQYTLDDGGMS